MFVSLKSGLKLAVLLAGTATLLGIPSSQSSARSIPSTATATGEAWYTITSAGWDFGDTDITDNGGNFYQEGVPLHPMVTALVRHNGPDTQQEGQATYKQQFIWKGAGAPQALTYDSNIKVSGRIEYPNQSAHAESQTSITVSGLVFTNMTVLDIPAGTFTPFDDSKQPPASHSGAGGNDIAGGSITVTAIVEAKATTP